jgi:hypothetical protein
MARDIAHVYLDLEFERDRGKLANTLAADIQTISLHGLCNKLALSRS